MFAGPSSESAVLRSRVRSVARLMSASRKNVLLDLWRLMSSSNGVTRERVRWWVNRREEAWEEDDEDDDDDDDDDGLGLLLF